MKNEQDISKAQNHQSAQRSRITLLKEVPLSGNVTGQIVEIDWGADEQKCDSSQEILVKTLMLIPKKNTTQLEQKKNITRLEQIISEIPQWQALSIENLEAIAAALESDKSVSTIKFVVKDIDDSGAIVLAKALELNTAIEVVNLCHNKIGDAGVEALAKMLKVNNVIKTIRLEANRIGDKGAISFAEMLKVNKVIKNVDLSVNEIGYAGVRALAEALAENDSVTSMVLWGNRKGAQALKILFEVILTQNDTLEELRTDGNIPKEVSRKLEENRKRNAQRHSSENIIERVVKIDRYVEKDEEKKHSQPKKPLTLGFDAVKEIAKKEPLLDPDQASNDKAPHKTSESLKTDAEQKAFKKNSCLLL